MGMRLSAVVLILPAIIGCGAAHVSTPISHDRRSLSGDERAMSEDEIRGQIIVRSALMVCARSVSSIQRDLAQRADSESKLRAVAGGVAGLLTSVLASVSGGLSAADPELVFDDTGLAVDAVTSDDPLWVGIAAAGTGVIGSLVVAIGTPGQRESRFDEQSVRELEEVMDGIQQRAQSDSPNWSALGTEASHLLGTCGENRLPDLPPRARGGVSPMIESDPMVRPAEEPGVDLNESNGSIRSTDEELAPDDLEPSIE